MDKDGRGGEAHHRRTTRRRARRARREKNRWPYRGTTTSFVESAFGGSAIGTEALVPADGTDILARFGGRLLIGRGAGGRKHENLCGRV